ncbi:MAG: hypothetical protein U5L72_16190 [Bacteroidales bacterium]|nr:hypothetical protein [Bacteroidales bacterium]
MRTDHGSCSLKRALDRFITGTYRGDYQERLIIEFQKSLPEKPSW